MILIVFRSRLREEADPMYEETAARMLALARTMPGFVSFETFSREDGQRVSLVEFETLEDVARWRAHPEHREAQRLGRERFYAEYRLTVAEVVRDYGFEG